MTVKKSILVSACLLGLNTRYDGQTKECAAVLTFLHQRNLRPIPICPEQLGGLPTPRLACSFSRGDGDAALKGCGELRNSEGQVLTQHFISGARQSLKIAMLTGCTQALLKERSPSCGVTNVYQGTNKISGKGVTTALLSHHGIQIFSEENLGS